VSGAGHDHEHDPLGAGHRRPLTVVLGISGTILAVEVAGAVVSGSLALLADAGQMLTGCRRAVAGPGGRDTGRPPRHPGPDLGYRRAEVLAAVPHVHAVHDLHASSVSSDLPVLTAHVVVDDSCFRDVHLAPLLDQLQQCLAGHFDVEHCTVQFEPASHAAHEHAAHA